MIRGINVGGVWKEEPKDVKENAWNFFLK